MKKKKTYTISAGRGPTPELQKVIKAFPKEVKLKEKAAREKKEL